MNSDILTLAIQKIREEHSCRIFNIEKSGSFTNEDGEITWEHAFAQIPAGMVIPTSYRVNRETRTSIKLRITCQPISGIMDTEMIIGRKEYIPVYSIVARNGEITDFQVSMCKSRDITEFRNLPEPNEEGNYLLTPPGNYLKACRK